MEDIIKKISQYNLFNYLLPGVIYSIMVEYSSSNFSFIQDDIIITLFVCYFLGLLISRFASLVVKPLVELIGLIKFKSYPEYLAAEKVDPKLDTLSEQNNIYRNMLAMVLFYALTIGYEFIWKKYTWVYEYGNWVLLGLLALAFFFAYKKQTSFITERIDKAMKS